MLLRRQCQAEEPSLAKRFSPSVITLSLVIVLTVPAWRAANGQTLQQKHPFSPEQQLVIAAFELDTEGVTSLLAHGANPNGRLGFYDARLFEDKWILGYSHVASRNWTPLLAVANSHREPQPSAPPENTVEARDQAIEKRNAVDPKLIQERDERRVVIAKLLIAHKADLDSDDGYGGTALDSSIYKRFDSLALLLIESGANPNTKTGIYIDGTADITPLHRAAHSAKVLKALLEHGATVSVRDAGGTTPLHWAVSELNAESVSLLIEACADVNAKDNEGDRPIDCMHGSDNRRREQIRKLLQDAGAHE